MIKNQRKLQVELYMCMHIMLYICYLVKVCFQYTHSYLWIYYEDLYVDKYSMYCVDSFV